MGRQIEYFMPNLYADIHMTFLRKKNEYQDKSVELLNMDRLVFGRHGNGYIFPFMLSFVDMPSIDNLANFVTLATLDSKISENDMFLLLDKETKILDLTSSKYIHIYIDCINTIKLTKSYILENDIKLHNCFPEITLDNLDKFSSWNGVHTQYFKPNPKTRFNDTRQYLCK